MSRGNGNLTDGVSLRAFVAVVGFFVILFAVPPIGLLIALAAPVFLVVRWHRKRKQAKLARQAAPYWHPERMNQRYFND